MNRYATAIILVALLPIQMLARDAQKGKPSPGQAAPLSFIENKGQLKDQAGNTRRDIDFTLHTPGMQVFLGKGRLQYQWARPLDRATATQRMDVTLVGANTQAAVSAEDMQPYHENFYTGGKEITAYTYRRVTYKNIYPHIDWVVYIGSKEGEAQALEYDFVVHEGGKTGDIKIKYKGANLSVRNGALHAATSLGSIAEQAPYTYYAATKKPLASSFVLQNNILSFKIAPHKGDIVIDPLLIWSTYYGGAFNEMFNTIVSDPFGNIYAGGNTNSNKDIATTGSYKDTISQPAQDAFLVKFSATGQRLWATYYGGNIITTAETFNGLACDKYGFIYGAGITSSPTLIATTGSFKDTISRPTPTSNGTDLFLVKFNANGQRQWATYYGGNALESGGFVACDTNANVYLAGATQSVQNIATAGTWRAAYSGSGYNSFLARFDSAGKRKWGTYYGQSNTAALAVTCDKNNNIYIGGSTGQNGATGVGPGKIGNDSISIASVGATQTSWRGSTGTDGYVVKFDTTGNRAWGTYIGSLGNSDAVTGLFDDGLGNLYVSGNTNGPGMDIDTAVSYQRDWAGNMDGFIAKFNGVVGTLKWNTYYGGGTADQFQGITYLKKGFVVAAGFTNSNSGIASPGNYQDTLGGSNDGFITIIDSNCKLLAATYFGGVSPDAIRGVTSNDTGDIYVAGQTFSINNISTVSSYMDTLNGPSDGFITKFQAEYLNIRLPFTDTLLCPGDTIDIPLIVNKSFPAGNNIVVELSSALGVFSNNPTVLSSKAFTGNSNFTAQGYIPYNQPGGTGYRVRVRSTSPSFTSKDNGVDIHIIQGPNKPDATNNGPLCEGGSLHIAAGGNTAGSTFLWTGPGNFTANIPNFIRDANSKFSEAGKYVIVASLNGCKASDTTDVMMYKLSDVYHPTSNGPVCEGDTIKLSATDTIVGNMTYTWTGPNGFTDGATKPVRANATTASAGLYTVKASGSECGEDTITLAIKLKPTGLTAGSNSPIFTGDKLLLTATSTSTGDISYSWTGPDSFKTLEQNPVINSVKETALGAYIVTATLEGCSASDTTLVVVNKLEDKNVDVYPNPVKATTTTLFVKGGVKQQQTIPLEIVNTSGQLMYKTEVISTSTEFFVKIPTGTFANGVYRLKLKKDGETSSYSFTVSK